MNTRVWLNVVAFAAGTVCVAGMSGCALLSKSDAVPVRYFALESPKTTGASSASAAQAAPGLDLRLGKVATASYIRERVAYRPSDHELAYYEQWRWTERPDAVLRRALGRELFETRALKQRVTGTGITLEVEVDAFEELKAPEHRAHVALTWLLRDDHDVFVQRTFAVDKPIADNEPASIAVALADALAASVTSIANETQAELPRIADRANAADEKRKSDVTNPPAKKTP